MIKLRSLYNYIRLPTYLLPISILINSIFYMSPSYSHDIADPTYGKHVIEQGVVPPIVDYKDGFGSNRATLITKKSVAIGLEKTADGLCSGTNSQCASVAARHEATRATVNNIIDEYFEEYAEWWQIIFWEGCPLATDFTGGVTPAIPTSLCPTSGTSKGIRGILPKAQEQVSNSRLKSLEIKAKSFTAQKQNDAIRMIQEKKIKSINEHYPSEELCGFASVLGGGSVAKIDSRVPFHETMTSVRYSISQASPVMADEKMMSNNIVKNSLCTEPNHDNSNESMKEICGTTTSDIDKPDIGDLIHKGNWGKDELAAAVESSMALYAANRPFNFSDTNLSGDKGKVAYMNHRSVVSRESLGAYCSLKPYQDKMGGSNTVLPYLKNMLETDYNMSLSVINDLLGTNPSLYTQRKVLLMVANKPTIGNSVSDSKENILRISNMIAGYKLLSMYEALDVMYCNQMMAAQLFTDELLPFGTDVQEKIDKLRIVSSENNENINIDYVLADKDVISIDEGL